MTQGGSRLIRHAAYVAARRDLVRAIHQALPGTIVFVVGMPGAGKTELRKDVMNEFAGDLAQWGTGRVPLVGVRAAPTDRSYFSPKDFQARLRAELQTPLLDWYSPKNEAAMAALEAFKQEIAQAREIWTERRRGDSENAMRWEFEQGARTRCVKYLFVDQAGSMARTQRGHEPHEHMYSLMCEAEEIPLVLVMIGTHRAAALWEGDSEIGRRSQKVIFRRYGNTENDLFDLLRLCANLTRDLRFEKNAAPAQAIHLVYHATCGVFDEVRTFYQRAQSCSETEGTGAITLKHLESAVRSPRELEALYNACKKFDQIRAIADLSKMPPLRVAVDASKS